MKALFVDLGQFLFAHFSCDVTTVDAHVDPHFPAIHSDKEKYQSRCREPDQGEQIGNIPKAFQSSLSLDSYSLGVELSQFFKGSCLNGLEPICS